MYTHIWIYHVYIKHSSWHNIMHLMNTSHMSIMSVFYCLVVKIRIKCRAMPHSASGRLDYVYTATTQPHLYTSSWVNVAKVCMWCIRSMGALYQCLADLWSKQDQTVTSLPQSSQRENGWLMYTYKEIYHYHVK